jgi:DNA-binding transcriptional LysR family regulator
LKNHVLLALDNAHHQLPKDKADWILQIERESNDSYSKERLYFTNIEHLYDVALEGLGIVALPNDSLLLKGGEFIPVLPILQSLETQTYLSYPKDSPKLEAIKF